MLRDTWLLVSLRWRILWNSFRHRSVVTQVFTVLGSVVLGVFVTFALFGVGWGVGSAPPRLPRS